MGVLLLKFNMTKMKESVTIVRVKKMIDEDIVTIEKRIGNAITARKNVDSGWGKQYWDNVIAYLLRYVNRLN